MASTIYNWNPVRPPRGTVLNRRSSLYCGLRVAMATGMEGGFSFTGASNEPGSWEEMVRKQGIWDDTATQTCYHTDASYGRSIEPGASPSRLAVLRTAQGLYNFPTGHTGRMTAMCLVRMDGALNATNQPLFKKRSGNQAVTDNGWELMTAAGNCWAFRVCDGVAQAQATSTTTQANEATLIRHDLLIGTCDGTNIKLWVNGTLEATTASAILPTNNSQDIRFFGNNSLGEFTSAYCGVACMWDRVLPDSAIQSLTRDPFLLWRHQQPSELLANAFVPGGGGVADDCCCCVINASLMF